MELINLSVINDLYLTFKFRIVTDKKMRFLCIWTIKYYLYGIRRSLIVVGSIIEVKQRRARFLIRWVTAWDCQVLYTVVALREPRKSDGSSDWPRVGRKRTSMDADAVSIRRDPRKFTMCEYLAHKANLLGMKIAWCASMAAQLYISQETELEFKW